jgi:serine/threonine protein kinase, bacterial
MPIFARSNSAGDRDRYDAAMLGIGESFAGFRIVRELGAGGMGEVYLAQHPRLARHDAIKILAAELTADLDFAKRFRREADLTAALWHPHIVGVHDRGECNGRLWISMDYVDGTDAAQLLADHPAGLAITTVLDIADAVADALDFAHERGLLHRDVKPANILMAGNEQRRRIVLADFGIGREIASISGLTVTNMAMGTVSYAAPEQLMGEALDGRADQYALAATVHHLLAGTPVFAHSNPAVVISRHLNAAPPALSDQRPDLAALDAVVQRALAKNPNDRYDSCTAFANALRTAGTANPPAQDDSSPRIGAARMARPAAVAVSPSAPTQLAPVPRPTPATDAEPAPSTRKRWLIIGGVTITVVALVGLLAALWPDDPTGKSDRAQAPTHLESPVSPPAPSAPSPWMATPVQPPPSATPAPPREPALVALPTTPSGSAWVKTRSGKTACQITAKDVGCQVEWSVPTPMNANGVRTARDGNWDWVSGDMPDDESSFTTLAYGTTYRALGWTVSPTSEGTTFTNDATKHGMYVSVLGVQPF